MKALIRFFSSKRARIAALAILGFAFLSFAAIVLVSEIFGFGEDEGKVYRKLGGDRVLLMNRDGNSINSIRWQGYADTAVTREYWWEFLATSEVSLGNKLKPPTHSRMHATGANGKILWELKNCRHGNTYTGSYLTYQNYLPFSSTSYTIDVASSNLRQAKATAATAGQIVMQNTPEAQVISSCYSDGIGTIYFDCVNGFTGYKDGKISVEVAYGVWKTNEAGLVVSREFPKDVEFYADGTPVPPDEAGAHEITVDVDGNVQTNEYGRCVWVKANMTGRYWSGSEGDIAPTQELKLELPIAAEGVLDNAGSMDNFYRVWVPVQDASINPHLAPYCRGPMRFRIKRVDRPSENSWRIQEDDLDGSVISGGVKYNALILIDNVIASFPAMKAEAVARGEYAKGLSNRGNVGWIDVLSSRCPAVGADLKALFADGRAASGKNINPAHITARRKTFRVFAAGDRLRLHRRKGCDNVVYQDKRIILPCLSFSSARNCSAIQITISKTP